MQRAALRWSGGVAYVLGVASPRVICMHAVEVAMPAAADQSEHAMAVASSCVLELKQL